MRARTCHAQRSQHTSVPSSAGPAPVPCPGMGEQPGLLPHAHSRGFVRSQLSQLVSASSPATPPRGWGAWDIRGWPVPRDRPLWGSPIGTQIPSTWHCARPTHLGVPSPLPPSPASPHRCSRPLLQGPRDGRSASQIHKTPFGSGQGWVPWGAARVSRGEPVPATGKCLLESTEQDMEAPQAPAHSSTTCCP